MFTNKDQSITTFQVQEVIAKKTKSNSSDYIDGIQHYKVIWKGYPPEEATWEPKNNLQNCSQLITIFETKIRNASICNGIKQKLKQQRQQQHITNQNYSIPSQHDQPQLNQSQLPHQVQSNQNCERDKKSIHKTNSVLFAGNSRSILGDNQKLCIRKIINVTKSKKDNKVGYFQVFLQEQEMSILVPRRRMLKYCMSQVIQFYESLILWDHN